MIKKLIYNDVEIPYLLTRKKVKNINLRIKPDCVVYISANSFISISKIEGFIISKGDWIIEAFNKYKTSSHNILEEFKLQDGAKITILGKELIILIKRAKNEEIYFDDEFFYIFSKYIDNDEKIFKKYNKFISGLCVDIFNQVNIKIYPIFEKMGIKEPIIKIRDMKSQWGSCNVRKKIITLNKKLIFKPLICIEYVFIHEYVHFIHPNHSKNFYKGVFDILPDYKYRKSLLKSI